MIKLPQIIRFTVTSKNTLAIILSTIVVLLGYWRAFFGFFQQDEWLAFNRHILLSHKDGVSLFADIFLPSGPHYTPFSVLSINLLFRAFDLNYLGYFIVSMLLHLAVVFLVGKLARILLKDFKLSLAASVLFGLLASIYQATTWVVADIGTHGPTIFGLVCLIYFFKFLEGEKNAYIISIVSLLISLLFKEIAVGLFILLPLYTILFTKKVPNKKKFLSWIMILGFVYIVLRLVLVSSNAPQDKNRQLDQSYSRDDLIFNTITFPEKAISQSIIPSAALVNFSQKLASRLPDDVTGEKSTPEYDKFVLGSVVEATSGAIFLIISLIAINLWVKNKKNNLGRAISFSLALIVINSLIFTISPEKWGKIAILDSRNLYFLSCGTAILLTTLFFGYAKKKQYLYRILFILLIVINFHWLNLSLDGLIADAEIRKNILSSIKKQHPRLPQKVIVFSESDKTFYGLPENERILPFQSGLGQTLLVWYYKDEKFPDDFLQNKFLWDIKDQGYKEVGGRGFGYFRDFEQMANTVVQNKIPQDSIIGFNYNSNEKNVTDISEEVRGRISGYLSKKRKLNLDSFTATASRNLKDVQLAIDGSRESFWDSKLPYVNPQYFELDLGSSKTIAQLQIDSYNNKNQNEVGYRVVSSNDGKNWTKLFESKILPPNKDGLVELYFKPTKSRFFRIEQIGRHQFASWVIHELSVYEVIQ